MHLPPFEKFPELHSGRILLREMRESDAPNVIEITFFQHVRAVDAQDAIEKQKLVAERYHAGGSIQWGIEDRQSGIIVGNCGYYRGFANETGEIGYIMKEEFRRSGYMSEAVQLIVNFGFDVMKLKEIFATTDADNFASQGVLRKNGFIADGPQENGKLRFHRLR